MIEEAEKTYRDAKNMSESLYGKYLLKTQKMVDYNTSVLLAKTEYDSLTDQQQLLIKEENELTRHCVSLTIMITLEPLISKGPSEKGTTSSQRTLPISPKSAGADTQYIFLFSSVKRADSL